MCIWLKNVFIAVQVLYLEKYSTIWCLLQYLLPRSCSWCTCTFDMYLLVFLVCFSGTVWSIVMYTFCGGVRYACSVASSVAFEYPRKILQWNINLNFCCSQWKRAYGSCTWTSTTAKPFVMCCHGIMYIVVCPEFSGSSATRKQQRSWEQTRLQHKSIRKQHRKSQSQPTCQPQSQLLAIAVSSHYLVFLVPSWSCEQLVPGELVHSVGCLMHFVLLNRKIGCGKGYVAFITFANPFLLRWSLLKEGQSPA